MKLPYLMKLLDEQYHRPLNSNQTKYKWMIILVAFVLRPHQRGNLKKCLMFEIQIVKNPLEFNYNFNLFFIFYIIRLDIILYCY